MLNRVQHDVVLTKTELLRVTSVEDVHLGTMVARFLDALAYPSNAALIKLWGFRLGFEFGDGEGCQRCERLGG